MKSVQLNGKSVVGMSSNLSKLGIIEAPLVSRLNAALQASDVFDFPEPVEIRDLEYIHFVNRKDSHHLRSLSSRLLKSQSPMLVILQNLYQENKVATTIDEYLGAWAPSLGVVIAERPEKVENGSNGNEVTNSDEKVTIPGLEGDHSDHEYGDDNDEAGKGDGIAEIDKDGITVVGAEDLEGGVLQQIGARLSGAGDTGVMSDGFKRSQKPTSASMLKTNVSNIEQGDPGVERRSELNRRRTCHVEDLLSLREKQAGFDRDLVTSQMLKSFLNNPHDDPNRLLIDYWLSRLNLAKHSFPETDHLKEGEHVDEHGDVHLDESAASHLFGRLQQYTRDRRTVVGEFRSKALNARETFKKESRTAEAFRDDLKVKAARDFSARRTGAREEAVHRISSLNNVPGNDGAPPSKYAKPSQPTLRLPWNKKSPILEAKIKKAEQKLTSMAADLAHRRRDLASLVNKVVAKDQAEEMKPSSVTNQFIEDQASYKKHKENVEAIREVYKNGSNAFYSQLTEKMASGAQASLEAIDRKFTESDIYGMERGEIFDDLLWEVEEKRWRVETAENNRRKMCHDLGEDLEERINRQNKALFQVELERVERLQQLKDLKMERRARGHALES